MRNNSITSSSRGWSEYYASDGALFLRIQNVGYNELRLKDIAFVQPPDGAEARRTRVQPGDVLLSITADLGRTVVVPEGLGTAHINQHLAILRVEDIDPHYLAAFLSLGPGRLQLKRLDRVGVKSGLNFDDVRSLRILLPSLPEQRRIAAILDKADAIRSKKRQASRLSNQLIESGFLHFFGDCLNSGKTFSTGTLEQLAGRIVDCPHSTPQYSETETGYFCARSSDIQDAQINLSQTRFVTSETYGERVARHVPQPGEVIYTREGGRLGNAAQIPLNTKICLGQRMMLFSAKDKVSTNEFIWALLNSPGIRHQVDSLIAGAAAPRINIADIRRLEVILPPFELQQQFSHFVQKVHDQRVKSSKLEDELRDLFNSLVQRAFRGEL